MLQPTNVTGVSIERQEKILALIRSNPLGSFVFSGAPGVGKTTLLRELERCSRAALPVNHPVYFTTMMQFQRDTTAKSRGIVAYSVTAESVRNAPAWGGKTAVLFDDFDKLKDSEFIRLHVFDVVDAVVDTNAQLALSTNMNRAEFSRFFADTIAWRVLKHCTWVEIAREAAPVTATAA